jgi:hypothetical protein
MKLSVPVLMSAVAVLTQFSQGLSAEERVRFGRDVLPILSSHCFACHGPDESERKAGLRLDLEAEAKAMHESGLVISPGKPDDSTLIQRITSTDPDLVMPPLDSHKELKPRQIAILRRWISEGAEWGRHWSLEPVDRPAVDRSANESPIDVLVAKTLVEQGLNLRPAAEPHQLVRRIYLDLIGIPPTPEIADAFAADPSDATYERLIDDLLANPKFGEHWTRLWMDLARYADTKGYEKDLGRTMWPYRDWLIRAINDDMPLDQMTVEQLAGDLLPNPTTDQLIATAFHRNTMSNDEGGTDDEEFRTIAVKDRVDTTMQVWMGLTAGCAKCHTHKYDPISQHEYYGLYAIFNQTQDADRYDDFPTFEITNESIVEKRAQLAAKIAEIKARLVEAEQRSADSEDARWRFGKITEAVSARGATLNVRDDSSVFVDGETPPEDVYTLTISLAAGRHTVLRIEALTEKFPDGQVGVGRNPRDPNFVLSELEVERFADGATQKLALTNPRADYAQDGWPVAAALDGDTKTGWAVSPRQRERHVAMFAFAEPLQLEAETTLRITMRQHYGDSLTMRRFRIATIGEVDEKVELPQPSAEQRQLTDELAAANKVLQDFNGGVPKIPVLRAVETEKHRVTRVHRRGNFLDPGDEVSPHVPATLHSLPEGATLDRLALAKWLMSPENTLTSRVWANRIWARIFGAGIVETEEDFGALGAVPTHPELLDWLASEYRDNGWSFKKFLKPILLSRTYRQASEATSELRETDPRNHMFSRGSRYRLSAEVVRDASLAAAGLLSDKMGGPPVMPPQPDGLWRSTYNGLKWVNSEGEDRFRRALYTYLKRTTPYPSMTTFDGGSGEVCQIRRIRTNTPLQALVTLNDPVFLEAAGALAIRMVDAGPDAETRALRGLRLVVIRPVQSDEIQPLLRLHADVTRSFMTTPENAVSLIQSTRAQKPGGVSDAEFGAWIVVANTLLNLDEFLTRN